MKVQHDSLIPAIAAGLVIGILYLLDCSALASLVFQNQFVPYLNLSIKLFLAVGFVFTLVQNFSVKKPTVFHVTQEAYVVLMAALSSQALLLKVNLEVQFMTLSMIMLITSMGMGFCFYLAGRFKLGYVVQFIPYPVMSGYFAGLGAMIFIACINVMVPGHISLFNLYSAFSQGNLLLWLPSCLFAILTIVIMHRLKSKLVFPMMLVLAVVLFYSILWVMSISVDEARAAGFLYGAMNQSVGGNEYSLSPLIYLKSVHWTFILDHIVEICSIILVNLIGITVHVNAINNQLHSKLEVSKELKRLGYCNIALGFFGAPSGYHAVANTTLYQRFGGVYPLSYVITLLIIVLGMFFSNEMLLFLPKSMFAVILFFISIEWTYEYLIRSNKSLPRIQYFVVLTIFIAMLTLGFAVGVGLGFLFAAIIFVYQYSRTNCIRQTLSGIPVISTVKRSPEPMAYLAKKRDALTLIQLQGYLFFGNTDQLVKKLTQTSKLQYLIIDFKLVNEIDVSALNVLARLINDTQAQKLTVVFSGLKGQHIENFKAQLLKYGLKDQLQFFSQADRAIEWCEDQLLQGYEYTQADDQSLKSQLRLLWPEIDPDKIQGYLKKIQFKKGDQVYRQGDSADSLHFIHRGSVNVYITSEENGHVRLSKLFAGNVIGEIGFYLKDIRSADVICDSNVVLYELKYHALEKMRQEDSELGESFHYGLVKQLSERLKQSNIILR